MPLGRARYTSDCFPYRGQYLDVEMKGKMQKTSGRTGTIFTNITSFIDVLQIA